MHYFLPGRVRLVKVVTRDPTRPGQKHDPDDLVTRDPETRFQLWWGGGGTAREDRRNFFLHTPTFYSGRHKIR